MDLSRYAITGEKEAAETAAVNNARLILIRWPYLLFVFATIVVSSWLTNDGIELLPTYLYLTLFGLTINAALFALVRVFSRRLSTQQFITAAQLIFDLMLAGLVTYIQGGEAARTTILFMFPIMSTALIFGGQAVMLSSLLSGATYVAALLLHEYIASGSTEFSHLLLPMIFYPVIFLLLGRIVRYLQHVGTMIAREKAYNSFLSLLAHQLKHPASATTTIIDAVQHNDKSTLDETSIRYIDMLKTENENQIRLIDNLLEIAPQKKATSFEHETNLVPLITKIARRVAVNNDRENDLSTLPNSLDHLTADINPIRFNLALTNIFDNAFRYSKSGEKVQYRVSQKNGEIQILVRDSGSGMSKKMIRRQLSRLADEGIRAMQHGHVGGLGIGLFAASRIVRDHGGALDIHSVEKVGTTVIISLKKEHKK